MNEDNRKIEPIPYIYHEGMMARQERTIKRLWVLIILLILTNAFWIWYELQFEDVTVTQEVTQDSGDGGTNSNMTLVGGEYYGETDRENNGQDANQESP